MLHKIETNQAPQAIGPYSQAVFAGEFLFISGQIPIDPKTGALVDNTIERQTKQVLANLEAILQAAQLGVESIVKTEIFLKNLQDFPVVNQLYAEAFPHSIKPARQTIEVSGLPLGALVEISCIAYKPKTLF